ncbi:FAD-dependent oxidoreductase [Kitasatospora sp. A2-31]|uniref:FAD-dependent oxidoreductase n=1 Tax=Kitasatospora sp. A2-31 TaxID=2916414 RepID=UPI001EEC95D0|nr:FAD-dependent oxidoreductase [Kitasatospora sp. A2-31]MCG6495585.1 FAD-dependent oxidoreductase [Kitasatospora sp. A2-31]
MTTAEKGPAAPPDGPRVLIAGAGPVGLATALELARRGVPVRLVDAAEGPAATSRAMATHARSLEVYDQQGVLADMMPRGRVIQRFTMHLDGRRLAVLGPDYSRVPTRFPMTLMIDQAATEDVLRQAVAKQGVEIEWGVRLEGFEQQEDGVTVELSGPAGPERTTVGWLVGCDGGHSTVRRLLGLPLIGDSTETWLIADAEVDVDLPQNSIHWIKVGSGTVMAIPFPQEGKWRLLDTADTSYEGDPQDVAERFAGKLRRGLGRPVTVHRPGWVSVFTIQQRMIPAMRSGRCLLAGDAAHVHSPASGQGLNTGLQDAYNLAWKLALVEHGHADPALLDSYSAERVPVGRALLGSTRKATRLVQLRNSAAGAALPVVFALVRAFAPLRGRIERKIIGSMSALALEYADSPLTVPDRRPAGAAGPRPGSRLSQVTAERADGPGWTALLDELRELRPSLLVAAGPAGAAEAAAAARAEHGEWLSVRTVAGDGPGALPDPGGALRADLGLPPGGWLLVRPDGYLCARGDRLSPADLAVALDVLRGRRRAPREV